jgi:hypothetical protein
MFIVLAHGHGGSPAGARVPPAGLAKACLLRTVAAGETVCAAGVR